jgi:archaeosortase B (VPXXXP-CTERM-specific)
MKKKNADSKRKQADPVKKQVPAKQIPAIKDKRYLKAALLFCGIVILLDLVVWYVGRKEYLAFLDIFISEVITKLILLSGLEARIDSNTIYLANSTWVVTTECTAIFIKIVFTSFVLVYPASLRSKAIAILAGIPVIFTANILRLYLMAWIDKLKPAFSVYFHNYVWQIVFIVMVVFMWLVWIEKVVNHETKAAVSR